MESMHRLSKLALLVVALRFAAGEASADPPQGAVRATLGEPLAAAEPTDAPAPIPAKASPGFLQPVPPATLPTTTGAGTVLADYYRPNPATEAWRVRGEYLMWWTKGQAIPPLATTSPTGTPQASAGVLGAPGTQVLFGDERSNDGPRSGGRFQVLYWTNPEHSIGIETDFLFLGNQATNFAMASAGDPILARPIFDALTGRQNAVLTGFPGLVNGSLNATSSTSMLYGAELSLRSNVQRGCGFTIDWLAGFRFLGFNDSLSVLDTEIDARNQQRIDVADHFHSDNRFYGGQLGAVVEYRRGSCYLELIGKVALGGTCNTVDIDGRTSIGGAAPVSGGVLAVQSNIGHYRQSEFAVLPEVGFNFGYQVTPHLRIFAGYTFLYLSSVARAAEQVDLAVNPNLFVPPIPGGPQRPAFHFQNSDFWAQGVNVGVEWRY
jgi:Putative beta barrel porin-7 (BBP7)